MAGENRSQELRSKNIEEIKNYFIKEVNQNKLISMKHKKVCTVENCIENCLISASVFTECVSISASASLGVLQ